MLTVSQIVAAILMDQACARRPGLSLHQSLHQEREPMTDDEYTNELRQHARRADELRLAAIDFDALFALGQDAVLEVCDMSQWCDGPAHYKPRTFVLREQLKSAADVRDWLNENAISVTLALESAEQFNVLKVTK